MTLSSAGVRRALSDEITAPLQLERERPGVDVVWMKPNMSAVLSSTPKSVAPQTVRPMRAATGKTSIDCEEKRDPRNDATL